MKGKTLIQVRQESCAIAKMTTRCALYVSASHDIVLSPSLNAVFV